MATKSKIYESARPKLLADGTLLPAVSIMVAAGKQTPRRIRRAVQIMEAARDVFLEKGFERASVSEIAANVGVVEGLVYTYFPTKRDLLNEVLRSMYEPLIKDMGDGYSRVKGLRSRLRFLIWRHLRVYVEEPGLARLVLHEVRASPDYFNSVLYDLHVRYTSYVVKTVREAVNDGELLPAADAEMIRSMVYGGIEHRMWPVLFGPAKIDLEATADHFTATILNGILPVRSDQNSEIGDVERRLARLEKLVTPASKPRAKSSAAS